MRKKSAHAETVPTWRAGGGLPAFGVREMTSMFFRLQLPLTHYAFWAAASVGDRVLYNGDFKSRIRDYKSLC